MSEFGLPRDVFLGAGGDGGVTAYTMPAGTRLRVETITFTLTTGSGAYLRNASVNFASQAGWIIASVQSMMDVPASSTTYWTFGIGLMMDCGLGADGDNLTAPLPDTVLEGGSAIGVAILNESGSVQTGNVITDVVIYGTSSAASLADDVIPLLTPLALSDQTAEAVV